MAKEKVKLEAYLAEQLKKSPAELFTIEENSLKTIATTKYEASVGERKPGDEEVVVYVYSPEKEHFIIVNPENDKCKISFEPYDSDGKFINGLTHVYIRHGLTGFVQPIYLGGSEFSNPEHVMEMRQRFQFGAIISPGDTLEVRFLGLRKIDPTKSKLKMTLLKKVIKMGV
jgi:hypothetical protein